MQDVNVTAISKFSRNCGSEYFKRTKKRTKQHKTSRTEDSADSISVSFHSKSISRSGVRILWITCIKFRRLSYTLRSETAPGAYVPKMTSSNPPQISEVEFAACEFCGLTEECTPAYIARVKERFYGRWVCGLCGEAVKDELCRSDWLTGMEEAMEAHMTFCKQLRANPASRLVGAMRQLLRRSLDSSSARGGLRSCPVALV